MLPKIYKNLFTISTLFLFIFLLLLSSTVFASETETDSQELQKPIPIKIAVMPTISQYRGYKKIIAKLDADLNKQMHLPLNDTLQTAEYIEAQKVLYAMEDSGFTIKQNVDTLKQTADLLNADVIVGYSVPVMYQQYYYSFARRGDGPLIQSYISLKLWAYYRPLDKFITLTDIQYYFDEISTFGNLNELASHASYKLSKKADLKNLLKQSIQINQNK